MFGRGRLDHFALQVRDADSLDALRERLLALGASDGVITDFGAMRVLTFTDPDRLDVELAHWVGGDKPGRVDMSQATDRAVLRSNAESAAAG